MQRRSGGPESVRGDPFFLNGRKFLNGSNCREWLVSSKDTQNNEKVKVQLFYIFYLCWKMIKEYCPIVNSFEGDNKMNSYHFCHSFFRRKTSKTMAQLTEKTADEKGNWIAARTIGERVTIVWFDRDHPLGVTWTGTIMSVDATAKKAMILYKENPSVPLLFPPPDQKIHKMDFQSAAGMTTGGIQKPFSAMDVLTYGVYLDNIEAKTPHERVRLLRDLQKDLHHSLGITQDTSRSQRADEAKAALDYSYRQNDLVHAVMAWAAMAATLNHDWKTDAPFLEVGNCIVACMAANRLIYNGQSAKAFAQRLDKQFTEKGTIAGAVGPAFEHARGKKPGEAASYETTH